jgi:hypothetical protein
MDNRDNRDLNDDVRDRHNSTAPGFVSHEDTGGEQVAGTVGGAAVGAAWGTLAGPIGTILGGLAGAVGGWWAARSATEQHLFSLDDDSYYRSHHDMIAARAGSPNRYSYDDVRPAYQVGHYAGTNPDYSGRSFDEVEPHLRTAYTGAGQNNWDDVRGYARDAWTRGREVGPSRVGMATGAMTSSMTEGMEGTVTGDRERSLRGGEGGVVDRIADAADDLKDRVDGNPASRAGRDATDRPTR